MTPYELQVLDAHAAYVEATDLLSDVLILGCDRDKIWAEAFETVAQTEQLLLALRPPTEREQA